MKSWKLLDKFCKINKYSVMSKVPVCRVLGKAQFFVSAILVGGRKISKKKIDATNRIVPGFQSAHE